MLFMEDIDLDFDELEDNQEDILNPTNGMENLVLEDVDLDFDELESNGEDTLNENNDGYADEVPDTGDREASGGCSESFVEPISFSESEARLFPRGNEYLLMESDLQAVSNYFLESKDGYQVLEAIAEAHNIDASEIRVLVNESELFGGKKVKKAKSNGGLDARIKSLSDALKKIPKASPAYKEKANQLKKLRAQKTLKA